MTRLKSLSVSRGPSIPFLFFVLITSAAANRLYGQAASGSLFGTVTDPTGSAVSNAKVTITSTERGNVYTTTTNDSGNYQQTQLLPGHFSLDIQATGFQHYVQKDIAVSLGQSQRADVSLTVGDVNTEVTVSGDIPAIVTDRAEVTVALENKQITGLPTVNRNFTYLQLAMPGSQLAPGQHAASENPQQGLQINTNGQRFGANSFMIDGADNNDKVLGIIVVNPSIDAVSEARFTTGNYDAEFSQAGGALIQVEIKSGTNQYHGSLFEYLQNNVLNARNPFSQPNGAPPLRWNQFGGSLGAPIKKDKLFVFGDYQGTRRRTGSSILTTVPTQAERNGDFSALGNPIFDPNTGGIDGTGRAPFTGNVIPPSRIATQATNVLGLLPMPNAGPPGAFNSNYNAAGSQKFDTDQFDTRADHVLTDRLRYFGRYSWSRFNNQSPAAFGLAGGPGLSGLLFAGLATALNQNLVAGFNRVLKPTLLTDFRFGFTKYRVNVQSLDYGVNASAAAGIPGINMANDIRTSGLSEFNVTGSGGFQAGYGLANNQCNCPLAEREYTYQAVNNWTKVLGNHTLKWGADVRYAQNLRLASDSTRNGLFTFSPSITGSAAVSGSGLGPAAFLLGLPSAFTRMVQQGSPEDLQWSMFYFMQDTWRATQKLTLSYGLRWDTWFPDHTLHAGQGGRYDVTINSILVAGVGNNDKGSGVLTQWHNLSPRLGIAYAFSPRTVMRTGWGRSYFEEIFGSNFNDIS
ncbi:MAG TPA: carboxypeptidase regulatory-like domain-containing protein, partial [Bryobacteraceae bacterium]|nr:carboxypeptidase regulatory-like domain-containing protein [Bryobacteraceae bacterium]